MYFSSVYKASVVKYDPIKDTFKEIQVPSITNQPGTHISGIEADRSSSKIWAVVDAAAAFQTNGAYVVIILQLSSVWRTYCSWPLWPPTPPQWSIWSFSTCIHKLRWPSRQADRSTTCSRTSQAYQWRISSRGNTRCGMFWKKKLKVPRRDWKRADLTDWSISS